jgi:hypothetical protein
MSNEVHEVTSERESDIEFARSAVHYLRTKGVANHEVAEYLIEEFGLDRETAKSMVSVAA